MKNKLMNNEFYAHWQCPECEAVNVNITDNFLLKTKIFKCKKCNKNYQLEKKTTQVLCKPIALSYNNII